MKMPIKMLNYITDGINTPFAQCNRRTENKRHTQKEKRSWQLSLHEVTVNILPFFNVYSMWACARACDLYDEKTKSEQASEWVSVCATIWAYFVCHRALQVARSRFRLRCLAKLFLHKFQNVSTKFGITVHRQRHFNEIHWSTIVCIEMRLTI